MVKMCQTCGKPLEKMYRHHQRQREKWISKLVHEITDSKGDVEFNIKSGHWYYTIWYCPTCDTISREY